jgi:hypothetical protein
MWLRNNWIQSWAGGWLERTVIRFGAWVEMQILGGHKEKEKLRLIRTIRRQRRWLLTSNEAFLIHSIVVAQSRRPGAMAEVGVFEGGSARMMCEAKGDVRLHLFDTFEGLPEATAVDATCHRNKAKLYACSLESVHAYLAGYPNVFFHKGLFPGSAAGLAEDETFSFAHIDVDLYESTLECLKFFYPRMIPGGIILSHDYSILAGVRKAFAEFLADKPEGLIELPSTQCMVIKA